MLGIVASTPASNTNFVTEDYDQFGTTAFITYWNITNAVVDSYAEFTLNASGLSNISKTGVSRFGTRSKNDIINVEPSGSSVTAYRVYKANHTGTTKDPLLTVTYARHRVIISNGSSFNKIVAARLEDEINI